MKLVNRVGYYLGGFTIGIILVFFFLSGKKTSCSYFPNARVLKEIRSKKRVVSPEAQQFFTKNAIDTIVLTKMLYQGNVNFGRSETDHEAPCRIYIIDGKHQKKKIEIAVEECEKDTLAVITTARFAPPDE